MFAKHHWFSVLLLVQLVLVSSQEPATVSDMSSSQDCRCVTNLVLQLMEEYEWSSVTFLSTQDSCLRGSGRGFGGLLKQVWLSGRRATVQRANGQMLMGHPNDSGERNFLAVDGNATRHLMQQASEMDLLRTTSWAVVTRPSQEKDFLASVAQLDAFIYSDLSILTYDRCTATLSSAYRVGPRTTEVQHEKGGSWTMDHGFQGDTLTSDKLDRRSDFQGYPMKGIGVSVFDFFTTYVGNGEVTGYVGDLVTTLKKTHNFTLTYRVLEGYAYGKLVVPEKNQWNGMVGELQNKRVDLTVSELSLTRERAEVVTYTQPIRMISRKLFVALVEDNKKKILTYFTPMEPLLYVCIFISMLVMAAFLAIIDQAIHKYIPGKYSKEDPTTFATASWYIISALLQQGCVSYPSAMSPRILFWFGFIISVIIYTAYSATLVSTLAVERPATLPFTNLFELSKLSSWKAGCNEDDLFQVTASQTCGVVPRNDECQILYDVWTNNVMSDPDNLVDNYLEGLYRALDGEYVFIGVGVTTRYYIRQLPKEQACKIRELPGMYIQGGIGIGLQHNSPFQPSFDRSLQKIREIGLMQKLVREWLYNEDMCQSTNTVSADIIDVSSLFVVLVSGICLSIVIFGVEKIFKKKQIEEDDQPLENGVRTIPFSYRGEGVGEQNEISSSATEN